MSKRIEWIDALKGYGILFMMYGHIEFAPECIKQYTAPIMLVSFFLAAGYTFIAPESFKDFYLKKVRTLLWPWLVFASLNILLTQVLTFTEQEPLKQQFKDLFMQVRGKTDGLWFFPCMFMALLLYYVLKKLFHNTYLFVLVNFLLLIGSLIYGMHGGVALPWHIQLWGPSCFYMMLGNLYHSNEERIGHIFTKKSFLVGTAVSYTIVWFISDMFYPEVHYTYYSPGPSLVFYGLQMTTGVLLMLSFVQVVPVCRIIQYAGQCSLMYFAFHGKPKRLFTVLLEKMHLVGNDFLPADLVFSMLDVVVLLYILVIPCFIVRKFFPFLLGQKKR